MVIHDNPEVIFALNAVRNASSLARRIQTEISRKVLQKDDPSPVTVADFASQALVGEMIERLYPYIPLVGEEDSQTLQTPAERHVLDQVTSYLSKVLPDATPERVCSWIDRGGGEPGDIFWTVDPIDGTKGFVRGAQYVVALALVKNGEVKIGVLGCPNLRDGFIPDFNGPGSLLLALRDEGCWTLPMEGEKTMRRLQVSDRRETRNARVVRSFEAAHTNVSQVDRFAEILEVGDPAIKMDSQAKYALLAAGEGELMLRLLSPERPHYREKIWDQAAGSLILQEAGGKITDMDGNSLDFSRGRTLENNRGVLASNGHLHDAALKALREIKV
jgi:3'(2'), 5'-bisphosphate nucleotidase